MKKDLFQILLILALMFLPPNIGAQEVKQLQETKEIKLKKKELYNLHAEISNLEKQLQNKNKAEYASIESLEKIDKQKLLLNKLIRKIKKEENDKQKEIEKLSSQIDSLSKSISGLKKDYSKYICWLYKYNRKNKFDVFLNSRTLNQTVIRYKYLQNITEKNSKKIDLMKEKYSELISLKNKLSNEKKEKEKLTAQKKIEQQRLIKKRRSKERLLKRLKSDKSNITKEIERKKISEIEIKNLIADLIDKEMKKLSELRTKRITDKNIKIPEQYNYSGMEAFRSLRGKLIWPVKEGVLLRKFGENKNAKLKTVTQNYGIDILTNETEKVVAIADGFVSVISWIPGYGSVIIITHKGNYRTVYGHISNILVEEGDRVKKGVVLGVVNKSLEGALLHFEVWNQRNFQNPERWLVRNGLIKN